MIGFLSDMSDGPTNFAMTASMSDNVHVYYF
jgi:hypothetical protein